MHYPFMLPKFQDPSVYFLCADAEVKYVGETVCVPRRVAQHVAGKPRFDSVFILPTPERKLLKVERHWIGKLMPEWNGISDETRATFPSGINFGVVAEGRKDPLGSVSVAISVLRHAVTRDDSSLLLNAIALLEEAASGLRVTGRSKLPAPSWSKA
jgi:predicted GIY-YIG superfamily endonuclease